MISRYYKFGIVLVAAFVMGAVGVPFAVAKAKASAQADVDRELQRLGGRAVLRQMRVSQHHGFTIDFDLHGTPELNAAYWRRCPGGDVIFSK